MEREIRAVRLSFVILHLDSPELLEKTLLSILPDRRPEDEVLVVRACSYADPYQLADEVRFIEAPGAGWAKAANEGIRAAQGLLVYLVQSGVEIEPEGVELALRHFSDVQVAVVGPGRVDAQNPQRRLGAGWTLTPGGRIRPVAFLAPREGKKVSGWASDQANGHSAAHPIAAPDPTTAILRKQLVLAWGGFSETLTPRAAWVEMGLAFGSAGFRVLVEPASTARIPPSLQPRVSAGDLARDAEQLFWQWTPRPIGLGRLGRHLLAVVGEWLASGPTPAGLARLRGRWSGLKEGLRKGSGRTLALRLLSPARKLSIPPPHFPSALARDRSACSKHPEEKKPSWLFQER